jgi:predicted glutamine amidotransferase
MGKMNLLFSEGEHLFAYCDCEGRGGLQLVRREAPFARVCLQDEDWEVDLGQEKKRDQRGYVIATKPLTKMENWTQFEPGSLLVFKDGDLIYRSQP